MRELTLDAWGLYDNSKEDEKALRKLLQKMKGQTDVVRACVACVFVSNDRVGVVEC